MSMISWQPPSHLPRLRNWWLALAHGDPATQRDAKLDQAVVDKEAMGTFEGFLHEYERPILNYLWRMLGDEQLAYDLTQETFLRAWQHLDQIKHYEQPRAWLFHVATNLALRARHRRATPIGSAHPLDHIADLSSSDPTGQIVEEEQVRATLLTLAPRARAALILREVYGLDADEGAQALGMTRAAFKMAVSRAREKFRRQYRAREESL